MIPQTDDQAAPLTRATAGRGEPTRRFSAMLPESDFNALAELAAANGCSIAWALRRAARAYLEAQEAGR